MRATLPAMSPARGLAIVLSTTALCLPVAALGQAGDDQYDDPFSEEATGQGGTSTPPSGSSGGDLSQEPDLGGSAPTGTTTPTTTGGTVSGTTATGQLPNTGADPRLAILAGLALLLSGLGLRLRTADEVF